MAVQSAEPPLVPLSPEEIRQIQSVDPVEGPALVPPVAPSPYDLPDNDYTAAGLRRVTAALLASSGGDARKMPLDQKAEFFEWVMWRYHRNPYGQIATETVLPTEPGQLPRWPMDSDTATWNGTLMSALCWKYAVTKNPDTLTRITELLHGLAFFSQVTGKPGCYARCMAADGETVHGGLKKFGINKATGPRGEPLLWAGNPAKGTYNQLAGGYASLMMYAYDDLPPETQAKARQLAGDFVYHLIQNDYKIRTPQGKPTTSGDLTPQVAHVGVPFNAQVAYLIVALGEQYPPDNAEQKSAMGYQFYRLRKKHHVYYENPLTNVVRPQRVGDNPLVKGMNDRFHVMSAAYHSLALEVADARLQQRKLDKTFLRQMGETMVWTMRKVGRDRNAMCNFMYAGMVNHPERFRLIIDSGERGEGIANINRGVAEGIEQLRRFPLDRFRSPGRREESDKPQWVDAQWPDAFIWKADPTERFVVAGPPNNDLAPGIDYLAAYWLMRLHGLDQQPTAVVK